MFALGWRIGCLRDSLLYAHLAVRCGAGSGILSLDCDDPDFDADLKSLDFGGMLGAGVNIGVGDNLSLVIDAFYNLGLAKITDEDDLKNGAFYLLAGLSFTVGG